MAISPDEAKARSRELDKKTKDQFVTYAEAYLDGMLTMGHRDILVDQKLDDAIKVNMRHFLRDNPDWVDALCLSYRAEGWILTFKNDFIWAQFKES